MKKIYTCLLLVSVTLMSRHVLAQSYPVSLYSFSQFLGTYSAVVGGTVFGNASSDDQDFVSVASPLGVSWPSSGAGIPIGFNFNFAGNVYDCFGINNNGYIFLGQSALGAAAVNSDRDTGPNYDPLAYTSSTAQPVLQNMICAFGADLYQQASNSLRVVSLGTSPNQTLVVQFANFGEYATGASSINFQIRLYETSNIVDVVYGNFFVPGYGDVCQVGLRGSVASNDFNLRDINYNTPSTWANSTPGTDIYNTYGYYFTFLPSIGQTYRWVPPLPCSGAPALNTIVANSTLVCPGVSGRNLSLASSYSVSGISYQWQSATSSSVGPFTSIANATTAAIITPTTNVSSWYQLVATCLSGGSTTVSPIQLVIASTTTNTVPYFEGFEGIATNLNELPNCSWKTSNQSIRANTSNVESYNGSGFINYNTFNTGSCTSTVSYVYSNGIQLFPGVTYSTSIWYAKSSSIQTVSLLYGISQTSLGLTSIVSVSNPAFSNTYTPLTGTFQVSSAGIYYMAVQINNSSCGSMKLDDLSITVPCSIAPNSVSLSVNAPTFICEGQTATLLASGASTYSWSTGSNLSNYTVSPNITTTYSVTGTNTLTGCSMTVSKQLEVKLLPIINIALTQNTICLGSSISLSASGASSASNYTWNTSNTGTLISITPNISAIYSVSGADIFGCVGSASQSITVYPLPVVNVVGNSTVCLQVGGNFTASGASTYQWSTNSFVLQGTSVYLNPQSSTTIMVSGKNANGCVGTTTLSVVVDPCTSITTFNGAESNRVSVYPNPSNGDFSIEFSDVLAKTIELMDVTGKIVFSTTSNDNLINVNANHLSNGIYYLKIKSTNINEVKKLIKQ